MFTPITITGTFVAPNGKPAQGTFEILLNEAITNGDEVEEPVTINAKLDATGSIVAADGEPLVLLANDDVGTTKPGSFYTFTPSIHDAPEGPWPWSSQFTRVIPAASPEGTFSLTTNA